MAEQERISRLGFMIRIGGVVAMIVLASIAGLWLGERSVNVGDDAPSEAQLGAGDQVRLQLVREVADALLHALVALQQGLGQVAELAENADGYAQEYRLPVADGQAENGDDN